MCYVINQVAKSWNPMCWKRWFSFHWALYYLPHWPQCLHFLLPHVHKFCYFSSLMLALVLSSSSSSLLFLAFYLLFFLLLIVNAFLILCASWPYFCIFQTGGLCDTLRKVATKLLKEHPKKMVVFPYSIVVTHFRIHYKLFHVQVLLVTKSSASKKSGNAGDCCFFVVSRSLFGSFFMVSL